MAPNVAVNSGTPAEGGSLPPGGEVVVLVVVLLLGKDTVGTTTLASEAVSADMVVTVATTDGTRTAGAMVDGKGWTGVEVALLHRSPSQQVNVQFTPGWDNFIWLQAAIKTVKSV